MTLYDFVALAILMSVLVSAGARLHERWQIRRGGYPPKPGTVQDVIRLRDSGHVVYGIKRFRELPENRRVYTLYGAKKRVQEL